MHCKGCGEIIEGGAGEASIVGTDSSFHPKCMMCAKCNKPINGVFSQQDGKLVHVNCREQMICAKCGEQIKGNAITVSDEEFHPECFKCVECEQPILRSFRKRPDGERICDKCIPKKECAGCKKALEGKFLSALGGEYHPSCFKCTMCNKKLDGSFFQNESGDIMCGNCLEKSTDKVTKLRKCRRCEEFIREGKIMFGDRDDPFHEACFTCVNCDCKLEAFFIDPNRKYKSENMKYLCMTCGPKEASLEVVGTEQDENGVIRLKTCSKVTGSKGTCAKCKKDFETTEERLVFKDQNSIHYACFACRVCKSSPDKADEDLRLGRRQVLALLEGRYVCLICRKSNKEIAREIKAGVYQGKKGGHCYTLKLIDEYTAWFDHSSNLAAGASWHSVCLPVEGINEECQRTLELTVKTVEGVCGPAVGTKYTLTAEDAKNRKLAWADQRVTLERDENLEEGKKVGIAPNTPPKVERKPLSVIPLPGYRSTDASMLMQGSAGIMSRPQIDKSTGAVQPFDEDIAKRADKELLILRNLKAGSFTLADLRKQDFCEKNGFDPKNKENYIPDDLFPTFFGMSREAFQKQPKWKQDRGKKTLGIF